MESNIHGLSLLYFPAQLLIWFIIYLNSRFVSCYVMYFRGMITETGTKRVAMKIIGTAQLFKPSFGLCAGYADKRLDEP